MRSELSNIGTHPRVADRVSDESITVNFFQEIVKCIKYMFRLHDSWHTVLKTN